MRVPGKIAHATYICGTSNMHSSDSTSSLRLSMAYVEQQFTVRLSEE